MSIKQLGDWDTPTLGVIGNSALHGMDWESSAVHLGSGCRKALRLKDQTKGHNPFTKLHLSVAGLSGEAVLATADIMLVADGANILRPETVESLFYLWKATGDEIYRERGWQIFSAFMMYSRTEQGAFAKIRVRTRASDFHPRKSAVDSHFALSKVTFDCHDLECSGCRLMKHTSM